MKNPKQQFEEAIKYGLDLDDCPNDIVKKCESISDQQAICFAKWYDNLLTPGIGRDPEITIEEYFKQFKKEFYS